MAEIAPMNLLEIPTAAARKAERAARETATTGSGYQIVLRDGCHGRPSDDPPVLGYVESLAAALALARHVTQIPGSPHRRLAYRPWGQGGAGEYPADAPTRA